MKDINQFVACSGRKRSLRSYESPLNSLRKRKKKKTPVSVTPEELDNQITIDSLNQQSSSRNSVIVITDSDNEATSKNEEDVILSDIAECHSEQSFLQQEPEKRQRAFKNKTSRPSVIILENESFIDDSSSTKESSSNGENVAPSQVEDDVVELWSSLKSPQRRKKGMKKIINRYFIKCDRDRKANFRIDKKPDYTYLGILTNKQSIRMKKQKLKHNRKIVKNISETISQRNESVVSRARLRACNINIKETKKAECQKFNNPAHVIVGEVKTTECDKNHNSTNLNRKLREIVVDGCNVALSHTNGQEFSEKGIKIVIDYFESRGHVVKVFLPQHIRKRKYLLLEELYKKGIVVFTPSRKIAGKQITSYDDRYILEYATKCEGIVISSDQFRDLYEEKPEWRDTILNRLLTPTFVGDYIMFPEDPLGKSGPNLETFLRH